MLEIIAATNNKNKLREIREIFKDVKILSLNEAGIVCEPEENGSTFQENALIKARTIFEIAKKPVLSDDSGLMVEALDGRPGIFSARYAGEHGDNEANNNKLLLELSGIVDRRAKFVSAVALVCGEGEFVSLGEVCGEILNARRGAEGFGYDPLFYSYDLKKSFGEATNEEKNLVSHRGRALRSLRETLIQKGIVL